jgi:carboxypeptidase C (cathepsin A)
MKYNYQALHLFGTADAACTLLGNRRWIKSLNWKVTRKWEPWIVDDDLIGFKIGFGHSYTLATLSGLGHGAIYKRPSQVRDLVLNFTNSNG